MTFGENLRRERELRGIELREIAEATKISIRFLQALEQDRPDILPGGIFPRAFVRQYARYLGLDPDKLVADFVYSTGAPVVVSEQPRVVKVEEPSAAGGRGLGAALVIAVVLLAGGSYAWHQRRAGGTEAVAAEPVASAAPVAFPPVKVYPPPSSTAEQQAASASGLVVGLEAREDCWVSVQVDGVRLLDRVVKKGETERLQAEKEIVLNVGNAGGIGVNINGRAAAPLGKAGEVRRNVVINRETLAAVLDGSARPAPRPTPSALPQAAPEEPPPPTSLPGAAPDGEQ